MQYQQNFPNPLGPMPVLMPCTSSSTRQLKVERKKHQKVLQFKHKSFSTPESFLVCFVCEKASEK